MSKTHIIHQQLHNSVAKLLVGPAHVRVIGYLRPRHMDAAAIQLDFADMVTRLGLARRDITWVADGGLVVSSTADKPLSVRLSIAQTHYTYEAWLFGTAGDRLRFGADEALTGIEGGRAGSSALTDLDIIMLDETLRQHQVEEMLPESDILGAVVGGELNLATNLQPDASGRERYLLYANGGRPGQRLAESTINAVIAIENSFHLLSEPRDRYLAAGERLAALESDATIQLSQLSERINTASSQQLKEWLQQTTSSFAELAVLLENVRQSCTQAIAGKDRLRSTLRALDPKPLEGWGPLAEPLLRAANSIVGDYGTLVSRIESVRRRRSDAISLLHTRIDLLQRDQSFALQCSMHKTTKTQMAMQQSIEGLYIFIVAFYLTELVRLILEALHGRHLLAAPPDLLTAAFIPLALLAGFVLSGKARHYRQAWRQRRAAAKAPEQGRQDEFMVPGCVKF